MKEKDTAETPEDSSALVVHVEEITSEITVQIEAVNSDISRYSIDDKKLFVNLVRVLQEEINGDRRIVLLGTVLVVLSDNIFYIALNSNAAEAIGILLQLSEKAKAILHYFILGSGILSTTAMDLYAPGGVLEEISRLIRRSSIAPGFFKNSMIVLLGGGLTAVIGVSGIASLVYSLYESNIPLAVTFTTVTAFVNFLSASFFIKNIFDARKLSSLENRNNKDNNFLCVKSFFQQFRNQLAHIEDHSLEELSDSLRKFKDLKKITDSDILLVVERIKSIISHGDTNYFPSKPQQSSNFYMLALPLAVISFILFYFTGKNAFQQVAMNEGPSSSVFLQIFSYLVGICLGGVVGATTLFSSARFFHRSYVGTMNCDVPNTSMLELVKKLGKKLLLAMISFLSSLYTIDLVYNFFGDKNEIARNILYSTVPFTAFFTILNALSEVKYLKMTQSLYATIGFCCLNDLSKKRGFSIENIDSLIEQLDYLPNDDIEGIYQALTIQNLHPNSQLLPQTNINL